MADILKVMEREQLCSEHAAVCFLDAKRRDNQRKKIEQQVREAEPEWSDFDPGWQKRYLANQERIREAAKAGIDTPSNASFSRGPSGPSAGSDS